MGRRSWWGLPLDAGGQAPTAPQKGPSSSLGSQIAGLPQGQRAVSRRATREGTPRPRLPEAVVSGACSPYPSDAGSRFQADSPLPSEFTSLVLHGIGPGSSVESFYISLGRSF